MLVLTWFGGMGSMGEISRVERPWWISGLILSSVIATSLGLQRG